MNTPGFIGGLLLGSLGVLLLFAWSTAWGFIRVPTISYVKFNMRRHTISGFVSPALVALALIAIGIIWMAEGLAG